MNDDFSKTTGTYTYPINPAYANNAADLVEFRVQARPTETAFRITLNTMKSPVLAAVSIAIGGLPGVSHRFPFGANATAPADMFLTVHPAGKGMAAVLTSAISGAVVGKPEVTLDTVRRQIEVRVSHADWAPKRNVVRLAAGGPPGWL